MRSVSRRTFCLTSSALLLRGQSASTSNAIMLDATQAAKLRAALQHDDAYGAAASAVAKMADSALHSGPWSVVTHRPENTPAKPNDYYSEGPYWWPDPKNPTGPYIRKDGERYPGRFEANRTDLGHMCDAVLSLGMGAYLIGDARCGAQAATVLTNWFLDPKTRMNPNLQFGQAVRGHNTGRGTGIIDTVSMIYVVQGVRLLELAGAVDSKIGDGIRRWFADYTKWLTTSQYGKDEKDSGNNHATWWTAQVAAFASFTQDAATLAMAWDHYRSLVGSEIKSDGSCPREEERTNSLGYSEFNLNAFSVLCRVAQIDGIDLWTYRAKSGVGVQKAFDYLMPYIEHPDRWKKQQISKFNPDGAVFPGLAGVGLHSQAWLAVYRSLPKAAGPWTQFVDLVVRSS